MPTTPRYRIRNGILYVYIEAYRRDEREGSPCSWAFVGPHWKRSILNYTVNKRKLAARARYKRLSVRDFLEARP